MKNVLLSFSLFVFACCINSCKQPVKNDKIKNDIKIYEDGLHVEQAFLTNGDASYISDDNKVTVGERVCLRMIINGWKEDKGIVFMDAAQTVTTSAGDTLTSNPSLFGLTLNHGTVLPNANHVLMYQLMGRLNKPVDYILISFKVWDKTTKKSLHGSYKVYM